ncbi:MAG: mannose-1-phosphate guanylyltransferase [Anaerolineae bacterium]
MDEHLYAVIMAGGGGTRLWPLSRQEHPKQTLSLVEDRTLFQTSVDRLLPLLPLERIYVVTAADQVDALTAQYPHLPQANYIIEPVGRGTASCIGLSALHIREIDPEAVMIVTTADHHIEDVDVFTNALEAAGEIAGEGYLVTLGIEPTYPATGYGYIEQGERLGEFGGFHYYAVAKFTEKPDDATAETFVKAGTYAWNSGMFIWRADRILEEVARWMPSLDHVLQQLASAWGTPSFKNDLHELWPRLEKQTIDYGVMERATRVAVIPVDIGWSDIGTWASVMTIYETDHNGNVFLGDVLDIDNKETMVISHGQRLIAAVGLEGLIVVDTPDALLITRRDASQRVRDVVQTLRRQKREDLL